MRDVLIREIRAFVPADSLEAVHRDAILHLLESEDFSSRQKFVPGHVTAGAFIVHPESNRILLHHHRRLGRWLQMGGHLELGESPAAAALREAREESGLPDVRLLEDRILDLDVHVVPAFGSEPAHRHFDLRYAAITAAPEAIALAEQESLSLAWFSIDEAIGVMDEPCSTRAIKKIRRIIGA